jgi:hypothetical protein
VSKDDPLDQASIDVQVREQMSKYTLWLNAGNFEEMVQQTYMAYCAQHPNESHSPSDWKRMCAAALAVVEWRMGGRVRP